MMVGGAVNAVNFGRNSSYLVCPVIKGCDVFFLLNLKRDPKCCVIVFLLLGNYVKLEK